MRVFFDCEFTGLHQSTTLISIGLVSEDGQQLYCELDDYDLAQVDDWIRKNVTNHLWIQQPAAIMPLDDVAMGTEYVVDNAPGVAEAIRKWLSQWDSVEMWSDVYAYDWMLFCNLFGGAFNIPGNVYYIPFDLATLLWAKGEDPDVNREQFAGITGNKHNALHDALVIKACFEKLIKKP